jgi:CSLREA domain-containing protein
MALNLLLGDSMKTKTQKQPPTYHLILNLLRIMIIMMIVSFSSSANALTFIVNSSADTLDALLGDGNCADSIGNCSLRAAILEANAMPGLDIIELASTTYTITNTGRFEDAGAQGDYDITDDLEIHGNASGLSIIDANYLDRAFEILNLANVSMYDLTILNGDADTDKGGAIESNSGGNLHLDEVILMTNQASNGGAIYFSNSSYSLSLVNSVVENNISTSSGGGVFFDGNVLGISQSKFISNRSGYTGGAIMASGNTNIHDSFFSLNTADLHGGAIKNVENLNISKTEFVENYAKEWGGAIYQQEEDASINLKDSSFEENSAIDGGAIYNYAGSIRSLRSTFFINSADLGGAIVNKQELIVTNSTFSANVAREKGGAIFNYGSSSATTLELSNTTIFQNTADQGGGIYSNNNTIVNLRNTILASNEAVTSGNDCDTNAASFGPYNSFGYNLVGDTDDCQSSFLPTDNTGSTSSGFVIYPKLLPLTLSAGFTKVHPLMATSIAIDAGNPTSCNDETGTALFSDQQLLNRSVDGNGDGIATCDIGAYEAQ